MAYSKLYKDTSSGKIYTRMLSLDRREFLIAAGGIAASTMVGCAPLNTEATSPDLPQIVHLENKDFPLAYPSVEEFIRQTPECVERLTGLIERHQDDPLINPDLSTLRWFKEVNADYLKPPNLLSAMKCLLNDLGDTNWVLLEKWEQGGLSAGNRTDIQIRKGSPDLGRTHIVYDSEDIKNARYSCLDNSDKVVPISNLSLTVLTLYEYAGRLQDIATLVSLKNRKIFDNIYPLTEEAVKKAIKDENDELFKTGYRLSCDQNILQLALVRAIASLAGNPTGKVVGLERHMGWNIYKTAVGAGCLTGDLSQLATFINLLTHDAKY